MKPFSLLLGVAGAIILLLSPAAYAHGELVTTNPKDGATVKKSPDHIMVNLTETPSDRASVTVTDGCNRDVVDEIYTQQKTLHVLLNKGRPGNWVVDYKVISKEDGHKTASAFSFSVKGEVDCSAVSDHDDRKETSAADPSDDIAAPDTGPDADTPTPEETSLPVVLIAVGVVALIGIAIVVRTSSSNR